MISFIRLRHFRSYNDASFEFEPGVNIIVGPNASGKTNLLEAILFLSKGVSYRARDIELVSHNKEWAVVEGLVDTHSRKVTVKKTLDTTTKEFQLDGVVLKRLTPQRKTPTVLFEPSHLQLLTDSPEKRRQFIDDVIEQTDLEFEKSRREYKRILAQRNRLLKHNHQPEQLFVWDVRLSDVGAKIAAARKAFITQHNKTLAGLYKTLANKKQKLGLSYKSDVTNDNYTEGMLASLKQKAEIDALRGFTSVGPHRDDILLRLDEYEITSTGSRGEIRTALLALKLLELSVLEQIIGIKPLLLLDDVFSELDGARRKALTAHLQDHQTFITTTDADIVVQHFMDNCHVIPTQ